MKVAFDTSPLKSGHKLRGIGSYTHNLLEELKNSSEIELLTFDDPNYPPNADIIHHPYFDLFFKTLRPSSKGKTIVTIHDVIPLVFPQHFPPGIRGKISLYFQKNTLKNANSVIVDSDTSKVDVCNKLHYPETKVTTVYLAPSNNFKYIPKDVILKIKKKYDLPDRFILYVGDINWNKNIFGLIAALNFVDIKLLLVGNAFVENNAGSKKIIQKIKTKKLENKIKSIGFLPIDDLVAVYNLATATVMPSFYEGFGLPVLESMSCGTPVICSKNSSLEEIGEDAAIFCNPHDPNDIADKIKSVLKMPEDTYKELSTKSIKHAKKYTWKNTAKETIKVYKNVVQSN